MTLRKDLTGKRFGRLTVLRFSHSQRQSEGKSKATRIYYKCRCDCGKYVTVLGGNLSKGNTTSCRCDWTGRYEELTGVFLGQIARSAQVRGLPFKVSPSYLWELLQKQKWRCALTGWRLTLPKHSVKGTASLDRIDSSRGYVKGNVQWLHKDVNISKQDYTQSYFKKLCRAVTKGG